MLIMENSEEVLQILERFTKLKQKDIPKELDDYLGYVAKTGDTVYRWANIKYLFREKLMHVIKDFHDSTPGIDDLPQYPNVDPFNYETLKSALLERLELFNAAPFTVQRLCELLTDPRKQYSRIDKFMRALEKNILVVSTVEPGRKQPESENGDSLDSVVNGDISLDVNVDIELENESIFRMDTQTTSSSASSSNKSEDHSESTAKKAKIDNEESSSDKSKSGSDSDESSDDSDSPNSREAHKDDQAVAATSFEADNSNSQDKQSENDDDGGQKQEQNKVSAQQDTICSDKESDDSSRSDENSTENSYPVETEKANETELAEKSGESEEPSQSKEEINENQETEKIEPSCEKEESATLKSESSCENVENTHQSEKDSEIVDSKQSSEVQTETETPPSIMVSEEKSTENAEIVQQPQPEQSTTGEQKLPEQMSVEETHITPVETTTSEIPPVPIPAEEQTTSDQPMDEHLEPVISSTCGADSSSTDEVVMQSESDMATEPIKVSDDKTGPTGMDVDDTSQEEAMDQ